MQDNTNFTSNLLRSTLCGNFEPKYKKLIQDIMQENNDIGNGFFKPSHDNYVLKGYQEGSGSSSIGRHLLTQMVQDILGEAFRNESEYMIGQRANWGFTQAIEAIKEVYRNDYQGAIEELNIFNEMSKQSLGKCSEVVNDIYLPLYRRLPEHEVEGVLSNDRVWLRPNLIASYSFTNNFKDYSNWSDYTLIRLVPIEQIFLHSGLLNLDGFSTAENEVLVINPEVDLKITTEENKQQYQDYNPELVRILNRTSK